MRLKEIVIAVVVITTFIIGGYICQAVSTTKSNLAPALQLCRGNEVCR